LNLFEVRHAKTLLEAVVKCLRSCDSTTDGEERPAAILWTDREGQWASLVPALKKELPELLIFGEYDPAERRGPAIWLRCMVDHALDDPEIPSDHSPILYLPKVSRQTLRSGEDCPQNLRPLVELLYRGATWKHVNGLEWTVSAFLGKGGLGLKVARDEPTKAAMLRALSELGSTPLETLRGRYLEAEDFDGLLTSDVVRDLLLWMGNPKETEARLEGKQWAAFCSQAKARFGFDPTRDGELTACEKMVSGKGAWKGLWNRFADAPGSYPGIVHLLNRVPMRDLFEKERLPKENEREEEALRQDLKELTAKPVEEICDRILALEKDHGLRREWIWAGLGLSPLAQALKPLSRLAQLGRHPLGGTRLEDFAQAYSKEAWLADASAWEAVASTALSTDGKIIRKVVQAILLPWLGDSARAFQKVVLQRGFASSEEIKGMTVEEGGCLLFVDGLRYDLAQRLIPLLEDRTLKGVVSWRWSGLPSVTATCKPMVSPAAGDLHGLAMGSGFEPQFVQDGKNYYAPALRKAIKAQGFQIVGEEDLGFPMRENSKAWSESADIDACGHHAKGRFPERILPELERIAERIQVLLQSGWKTVRIVTDHGWLWVPRGLPNVNLPKHLTETKWARCAILEGHPTVDAPCFPWSWNRNHVFATGPGIACFNQSPTYAHGGVSVQECLTPVVDVMRSGDTQVTAAIRSVTWRKMRCLIEAEGSGGRILLDLRLENASGDSVVAKPKPLEEGAASLLVADDQFEEADLMLVLIGEGGKILAQRRTKVGENS